MLEVGKKAPEFSKETPNGDARDIIVIGELIC